MTKSGLSRPHGSRRTLREARFELRYQAAPATVAGSAGSSSTTRIAGPSPFRLPPGPVSPPGRSTSASNVNLLRRPRTVSGPG